MDESGLNIVVDADASGAVQAFDSLDSSIQGFGGQLGSLKTQMTSPYQHAGIFLFSRQLLGLGGMSSLAQHALTAVQLGFEDLTAAIGVSSAVIAPYLLGVGALIAVYETWSRKHKTVQVSLDKLVKSEDDDLKKTRELTTALDDYKNSVGPLPSDLRAVEVATQNLTKAQGALMALDLQKQLDDTNKKITETAASFAPALNATAAYASTLDRLQPASEQAATAGIAVTHVLDEQSKSTAALTLKATELQERLDRYKATGDLTPLVEHLKEATKAAMEHGKEIEKVDASWRKWISSADSAMGKIYDSEMKLSTETTKLNDQDAAYTESAWNRKSASAKQSMDQTLASIDQTYRKAEAEAQQYGLSDVDLTRQYEASKAVTRKLYQDKSDADARSFFGLQATMMQGFEQAGVSTFNQLANGVSSSFAKMVVEGKSMATSLQQVFTNIAESFITAIGEMMIKWAAFQAFTGIMGAGAGGAALGGGQGPMLPGMVGGDAGLTVPGYAAGGDFLATHPTLIAVGESGPERVQITPSGMSAPSAGSGGAGGGDTYVSISVSGAGDPDSVAQRVLQYLLQQTKGRGQVNPVGPSIYGR